jgi:hypothetical protein
MVMHTGKIYKCIQNIKQEDGINASFSFFGAETICQHQRHSGIEKRKNHTLYKQ